MHQLHLPHLNRTMVSVVRSTKGRCMSVDATAIHSAELHTMERMNVPELSCAKRVYTRAPEQAQPDTIRVALSGGHVDRENRHSISNRRCLIRSATIHQKMVPISQPEHLSDPSSLNGLLNFPDRAARCRKNRALHHDPLPPPLSYSKEPVPHIPRPDSPRSCSPKEW
jgi:hypothetical protein